MTQANRYIKLAALTKRMNSIDYSYHAAFYLLSHDPELFETACRYVTVDGINFTGLKRAVREFDERTRHVVDVAHNLFSWNSKCHTTPFDISRLGYPYMELVCNSLYIAAGEVKIVIQQQENEAPQLMLDATHYQRTGSMYRQLEQLSDTFAADMARDEAAEMER